MEMEDEERNVVWFWYKVGGERGVRGGKGGRWFGDCCLWLNV